MLEVQSAKPDVVLRPFVHWYFQRETVLRHGEIVEPVLPRAGTMLEFQFTAVYEVKELGSEQLRPSFAATVIGPIDARRVRLILKDPVQSLVILFRPLGLYRLFGVPVSPLTGVGTEGHALFGPQVSALYERLGNTADFADRVELLNRFFVDRLHRSHPLSPAALAMRRLASGQCNVGAVAKMIGISERQLERRSRECAGMSPKALARVSRFQRAIQKHRAGNASWLQIAHEVGYYDQMHLVRDFHNLGGGAPTQVMKAISDEHLIAFCCSS